jgi:hypothetical protein
MRTENDNCGGYCKYILAEKQRKPGRATRGDAAAATKDPEGTKPIDSNYDFSNEK